MITLPIIVLAALTGVSEGQTFRQNDRRQLATVVRDTWQNGRCYMKTSWKKSNITDKKDCLQLCSFSLYGFNYNNKEKSCYCIEEMKEGKEDEIWLGSDDMECFFYGNCGTLDQETCDVSPLCLWNVEGYCSKDSTGDEMTSDEEKIQAKLLAQRKFPKCSSKFDDKKIEPDTKCIDVNRIQCTKKQWDEYEHMCPGSEWEEVRCFATDSSISVGDSTKTQGDCKTTCDEKENIIAINFKLNPENNKTECECITEGTLNQQDDENTKCYIYPESIEDRCRAISEYSDCASDEWLEENCVPECGVVEKKLLEPPYVWEENDKLEPAACVNVDECDNSSYWERCPTRCEQLFVASKVGGYKAPVSENETTAFMDAFEEQREIAEEMKKPETSEVRKEHLGKKAVCSILKNIIHELKDEDVEIDGEINEKFVPYLDAVEVNDKSKLASGKDKVRQDLEQYVAKMPLTKTNDALIAEGICSHGSSDCIFTELASGDSEKIKVVALKFVDPEVHQSEGNRRRALQQRHLLITNKQATDVNDVLDHAVNAFDLLDKKFSSGAFGSLSGLAQFGTPALAVLNHENSARGRARSAIELGLNAAQMFLPGPVNNFFKFVHEISKGVNGSDACTDEAGRRVNCNFKDLGGEAGQILLTAGLEVIGNGHAKDFYKIVKIYRNIKSKGLKEGFNVKDVKTIGVAIARTACTVASFAFPIIAIPCGFAIKLGGILASSDILETDNNEDALDNLVSGGVTRVVHNVQKVLTGVVRTGAKFGKKVVQVVQTGATYVYKGVKRVATGVYNAGKGLVRGVAHAGRKVGRGINKVLQIFGMGRKENNPRPSQGRRRQQQRPQYRRHR